MRYEYSLWYSSTIVLQKSIFFKIANIVIETRFNDNEELPELYTAFKQKIDHLNPFIIKGQKNDFLVTVDFKNSFDIVQDNKLKRKSIIFYEEISKEHFRTYYHISGEQFTIIIRDIVQKFLSKKNGVILHGSAVVDKSNQGLLFLGESGAGKSTIVQLLNPKFRACADDILILRKEGQLFYLYQTPFIQKNYYPKYKTGKFVLSKIYFLKKGREEKTSIIKPENKIIFLLKQLFTNEEDRNQQIRFLLSLIQNLENIFFLTFSKSNKKKLLNILQK